MPAAAIVTLARTALLGLDAEHLRFTRDGLELTLTDSDEADARSCVVHLARHPHFTTCPVHALEDWLRASDCRYGPVFRKVDRWGKVEHRRLHPTALRTIVMRRTVSPPGGRAATGGAA